jgi:hypothetical protein
MRSIGVIADDVGRGVNLSGPSVTNDAGLSVPAALNEPELDAHDALMSAKASSAGVKRIARESRMWSMESSYRVRRMARHATSSDVSRGRAAASNVRVCQMLVRYPSAGQNRRRFASRSRMRRSCGCLAS